jgi:TolA-binding protein
MKLGQLAFPWLKETMLRKGFRAAALMTVMTASLASTGCLVQQRDHDALSAKQADIQKQLELARADTAHLREDLEATRQRLDNALRANADNSSEAMSSKQRMNDLGGRVDEVKHDVDELKKEIGMSRTEIYARMDEMRRLQAAAAPAVAAPPPVSVPGDKGAHYSQLKDAHVKRDWSVVRALGPEYVNRYPADANTDEVLYLMGDADLSDGRPSSALGHFNRLLKLFPKSKVLDKTLYAMGEAYMTMHDCGNAKLAYEACEKRYSKDKIGGDARAKLQTIAKNAPGLCAPQ